MEDFLQAGRPYREASNMVKAKKNNLIYFLYTINSVPTMQSMYKNFTLC